MKTAYLLTGRPGSGKTSLIKQAAASLGDRAGGFYTEEIRSERIRQGFRIVTLEGVTSLLAHIEICSSKYVGKYGVNTEELEAVGVPALLRAAQEKQVVVIDEIGRMELFSESFKATVQEIINSGKRYWVPL